jgi:hypothetical protein
MQAAVGLLAMHSFMGATVAHRPRKVLDKPGAATADPSMRDEMSRRRQNRQARRQRNLAEN